MYGDSYAEKGSGGKLSGNKAKWIRGCFLLMIFQIFFWGNKNK